MKFAPVDDAILNAYARGLPRLSRILLCHMHKNCVPVLASCHTLRACHTFSGRWTESPLRAFPIVRINTIPIFSCTAPTETAFRRALCACIGRRPNAAACVRVRVCHVCHVCTSFCAACLRCCLSTHVFSHKCKNMSNVKL